MGGVIVGESVSDSVNGGSAVESPSRRASFWRVLRVPAATAIVLVGVHPSALAVAVGVVLSGIAGFLGNPFHILMIVLFLLAEGPAVMLDTSPEARWLASVVGVSAPRKSGASP